MPTDPQALERIYRAKEMMRRELALLPFHKKIEILVTIQQRADAILRARGKAGRPVWKLPSTS